MTLSDSERNKAQFMCTYEVILLAMFEAFWIITTAILSSLEDFILCP